jgi:hypothetical protein
VPRQVQSPAISHHGSSCWRCVACGSACFRCGGRTRATVSCGPRMFATPCWQMFPSEEALPPGWRLLLVWVAGRVFDQELPGLRRRLHQVTVQVVLSTGSTLPSRWLLWVTGLRFLSWKQSREEGGWEEISSDGSRGMLGMHPVRGLCIHITQCLLVHCKFPGS